MIFKSIGASADDWTGNMKTYPIMLVLTGRQAVVVGGGGVALRKVRSLIDAGAKVRIVTKDLATDEDLASVEVIRGEYEAAMLAGAKLVFACTDDAALNARIAHDARAIGAIVNCVDQPADCDFFVPAIVSDRDVIVAIGTGGSSPALAGQLKRRIADALPDKIGLFAAALIKLRGRVKDEVDSLASRGEILKALSAPANYEAFCRGGEQALADALDELLT